MKVAVASGKGGTGKTLISTNLFHVIQQLGDPVELIDCDAEEPNTRQFIKGKVNDEEMVTQRIPVIDKASCTFVESVRNTASTMPLSFYPTSNMFR